MLPRTERAGRRHAGPRPGPHTALALAALALSALACVCRPEPAAILAAGQRPFRTPELCFETFRTAVGSDLKDLAYRCLSKRIRREEGVTQIAFRELLRQEAWLEKISCATGLRAESSGERSAEVIGEVTAFFRTYRFRIGFVREDYYELFDGETVLGDGSIPELSRAVEGRPGPSGMPGLALWVPLPPGSEADDVTLIRAGQEWKIDSFSLLDEEGDSLP